MYFICDGVTMRIYEVVYYAETVDYADVVYVDDEVVFEAWALCDEIKMLLMIQLLMRFLMMLLMLIMI